MSFEQYGDSYHPKRKCQSQYGDDQNWGRPQKGQQVERNDNYSNRRQADSTETYRDIRPRVNNSFGCDQVDHSLFGELFKRPPNLCSLDTKTQIRSISHYELPNSSTEADGQHDKISDGKIISGRVPDFGAISRGPDSTPGFGDTRETDIHKISVRLKQIQYGKNTIGYDNYTKAVPKNKRKGYRDHPRTPDAYERMSKKCFEGQVKHWRRELHKWDDEAAQPVALTKCKAMTAAAASASASAAAGVSLSGGGAAQPQEDVILIGEAQREYYHINNNDHHRRHDGDEGEDDPDDPDDDDDDRGDDHDSEKCPAQSRCALALDLENDRELSKKPKWTKIDTRIRLVHTTCTSTHDNNLNNNHSSSISSGSNTSEHNIPITLQVVYCNTDNDKDIDNINDDDDDDDVL